MLEITSEKVQKYESYLEEISNQEADKYHAGAATAYQTLKEKNLTEEEYGKEVYYLYVKYYYKKIESVLMSAQAPVLCDYYYLNFILGDRANYLYLLDDICVGSFRTDTGIPATFAGYYKGCASGVLNETSADAFVKDVFYNSRNYFKSTYFASAMQMAPSYILTPILVGFLLFFLCKVTKRQFGQKFVDCYKIMNSFAWTSALFTGVLVFLLAFFVFSRELYLFMPLIFALILIFRSVVFYFTRSAKEKAEKEEQYVEENDIF